MRVSWIWVLVAAIVVIPISLAILGVGMYLHHLEKAAIHAADE